MSLFGFGPKPPPLPPTTPPFLPRDRRRLHWRSLLGLADFVTGVLGLTGPSAKGDLISATGPSTAALLPVGTNGQVLTADNAAPTGLAWDDAPGGAAPTHILAGETYTVPARRQVLYTLPITIDVGGSLVVDGSLIMVS